MPEVAQALYPGGQLDQSEVLTCSTSSATRMYVLKTNKETMVIRQGV